MRPMRHRMNLLSDALCTYPPCKLPETSFFEPFHIFLTQNKYLYDPGYFVRRINIPIHRRTCLLCMLTSYALNLKMVGGKIYICCAKNTQKGLKISMCVWWCTHITFPSIYMRIYVCINFYLKFILNSLKRLLFLIASSIGVTMYLTTKLAIDPSLRAAS